MRIRGALRANSTAGLRPVDLQWWREYQACEAFGWTHDEYLDTPTQATGWLLHIHDLVQKQKAEQREQANRR